MRERRSTRYLGIAALLAAACWLCCRAHLRVPHEFDSDGGWPMLGGNSGHTGQYLGRLRSPLKLLWKFRTRGPIVCSPVVMGGVVCTGSVDKRLYLLSAWDGQPYGFLKTDSSISASPAIGTEGVYFATELGDDALYAVDLANGDVRWKVGIFDVSAALTLADESIFTSSGEGIFYAFSKEKGHQLWQFSTEGQRLSPAAVANGVVYFGSDDGLLYALEAISGRELWRRKLGGAVWASPIAYQGQVLVTSFDGKIYALGGKDGKIIWSFQMAGGSSSSPAIGSGTVYAGSDEGTLYALDESSGAQKWFHDVGSPIQAAPLVTNELIVFGATDGVIYALDSRTGDLRWSYQTERAIVSSPAAWKGRIYIGSMDGHLYAFGEGEGDSSAVGRVIP